MNASRRVRWLLVTVLVSFVATMSGAWAQQTRQTQKAKPAQQAPPAQKPYTPQVGQGGKDVVWVPTSEALVAKMLDMAKVGPQDYVMDLGSGDGRTVIAAAKRGATAVGVEFNPDMVQLSRQNAAAAGVTARATFINGDLFEQDLSKATVITMFLLPQINIKLRPKILDLKPGTRIVSNSFNMEDWEPDETATIENGCESWCTALFWIVPAKIGGTWQLKDGELTVNQQFQNFTGTLTQGGTTNQITDGKIRGDVITFSAGGVVQTGKVNGNTITATAQGKTGGWTATRK